MKLEEKIYNDTHDYVFQQMAGVPLVWKSLDISVIISVNDSVSGNVGDVRETVENRIKIK